MIEFEIDNNLLKRVIDSHKRFTNRFASGGMNCFYFELSQSILKVFSTEGIRVLRSIIEVNKQTGEDGNFCVPAAQIQHLVINKNMTSSLLVTVDDKFITFTDASNGTVQKFLLENTRYPDMDKIIVNAQKGKKATLTVNKNYFKDLEALLCGKYPTALELNIDQENNDCPLLVNSEGWGLKQTALIVPTQTTKRK